MVLPWLHGLLDDSESVTFGSHLKDCPACTQLVNAEKTRQKQWKGAVRSTYPEMVFTPPDVKILAKPTSQKLMMSVARYALAASLLLVAGLGIMGVFNSFRVESSRARLDADRQLLAQAQDKNHLT
jgi:predicted anti-sigma-YlaC factor YlaD